MMFHVHLAEDGEEFDALAAELRARSQQERKHVFWAVALNDAIDRETVELFRSQGDARPQGARDARARTRQRSSREESVRHAPAQDELRRLLRAACLSGSVYFRGNDRSPGDRAVDVGKSAAEILGQVLPEVFDRFEEAAAKATDVKKGVDALFTAENLQGSRRCSASLGLLRDEKGKTVFRVESGPLAEVLDRIEERANYGDTASGRFLADEFAKEPFGWDFEVVRLRPPGPAARRMIEATSKGQTIDVRDWLEAQDTFSNNNLFRQAAFRPQRRSTSRRSSAAKRRVHRTRSAARSRAHELSRRSRLRQEVASARGRRVRRPWPPSSRRGLAGHVRARRRARPDEGDRAAGPTTTSSRPSTRPTAIKEAIKRAAELEQALAEAAARRHPRARADVLSHQWPARRLSPTSRSLSAQRPRSSRPARARDFFRELPTIDQHASAIEAEYDAPRAALQRARRGLRRCARGARHNARLDGPRQGARATVADRPPRRRRPG